jgi:flagellar protein FliO/FliZ
MNTVSARFARLGLCCAALLAGPAGAQAPAAPPLAASVLQLVLGLSLVIALILGSLWLLKRISGRAGAASGLLQVVAGIAVGPRERVVLVEIGDTWLVLGVAPGRVNTLHRLPRAPAPTPAHSVGPAGRDFRGWLENALERKHAPR